MTNNQSSSGACDASQPYEYSNNHTICQDTNDMPKDFQPLPSKGQAWLVCLSSALFFFFAFIQMNIFNAIGPKLLVSLQLSAAQLGNLSANYFYAYVLMLFPAGIILDRYSVRNTILITMSCCIISTLLFSFAQNYSQLIACRFAIGVSAAFTFLASIRLAVRWFEPKRLALVIGCIVTMAMLGGTLAQTPLTLVSDHWGWRQMLVLDSCLGVIFLAVIYMVVQDYPKEYSRQLSNQPPIKLKAAVSQVVKNAQNWLAGFYTCMMNLPVLLLGAMWGGLYLTQVYHLSRTQSSLVNSMIFIGMIIGSPFFGWCSDRLRRRLLPMKLGAFFAFVVVMSLILGSHFSWIELMIVFLLLGFFSSAQIIGYAVVAESNPERIVGAAEGLSAVLIMSGGFLQPFFGFLVQRNWDHTMLNHVPVYNLLSYEHAMLVFPCAFFISLVLTFFIRETGAVRRVKTNMNR